MKAEVVGDAVRLLASELYRDMTIPEGLILTIAEDDILFEHDATLKRIITDNNIKVVRPQDLDEILEIKGLAEIS